MSIGISRLIDSCRRNFSAFAFARAETEPVQEMYIGQTRGRWVGSRQEETKGMEKLGGQWTEGK